MKSKKNLLEQLKPLSHFTKSVVRQLGSQAGLADATVDTYISRFLKYKELYRIKNGLYVTADFFDKHKNDSSYVFYLANITRTPSYVSSWAALQYYNLTTEAIHSVTSVTLKVTRDYQTKVGNFSYQSMNKELFSGFSLIKGNPSLSTGTFDFYIASPSKALFDLLYFRTRQLRNLSWGQITSMVAELRIDIDEMSEEEQKKFFTMIKKYE